MLLYEIRSWIFVFDKKYEDILSISHKKYEVKWKKILKKNMDNII